MHSKVVEGQVGGVEGLGNGVDTLSCGLILMTSFRNLWGTAASKLKWNETLTFNLTIRGNEVCPRLSVGACVATLAMQIELRELNLNRL